MASLLVKNIAYKSDSACLFECLVGQPGAVFLDSGSRRQGRARYDILTACPTHLIHSKDGITTVSDAAGRSRRYRSDPFEVVRSQLAATTIECDISLPFYTGAIGYFAYDLGWRIVPHSCRAADADGIAELMLGLYDWAIITDHAQQQTYLIADADGRLDENALHRLEKQLASARSSTKMAGVRLGELQSNMARAAYIKCFNAVKEHIYQGDCYQINLARRFAVAIECDAWQLYRRLRAINSAPYSAYLDYGTFQVLSISPERFLNLREGYAETNPIKGTRVRLRDPEQDRMQLHALSHSAKDKAENLMIVDLLRNDFGKSCRPGSITVDRLFDIESFDNVHHLVSTVRGTLNEGKDALDLLRDCFPGGSITGAPKLRAMQIIEELEPHRRGVYCGAIGYLSRCGNMTLNVAIRTALYRNQQFIFYGGGGIVADSDAAAEYQETLDKVSFMMDLLKEFAKR